MAETKKTLANAIGSLLENGCSVERKKYHISKNSSGYMILAFTEDADIKSEKNFPIDQKEKAISVFFEKTKLNDAAEGKS